MRNHRNLLALVCISMVFSQSGCGGGSGDHTGSAATAQAITAATAHITGVSATVVSPGDIITVTGSNFQKVNTAAIGGVTVAFTVVNDTKITITIPALIVNGSITLSGPGFSVQSADILTSSLPTVTEVAMTNVVAGTNFTIHGTKLDQVSSYQIAGTNLAVVNSSSTSATLTMPTQPVSGALTLIVGKTTLNSKYQINGYLPASITTISPVIGVAGSSVTINGSNLTGVTKIRFTNGAITTISTVSNNAITFNIPTDAASGPLTVITPYQEVQSNSTFTVAPIVTATALHSASNDSTLVLTITGTNLGSVTAARIGNDNATIVSSSNTQLVLHVSLGIRGTVTLIAPGQTAITAGMIDGSGNVGLLISSVSFAHVFDKNVTDPTLRLTPARPALVRATIIAPKRDTKSPIVYLSATTRTGATLGTLTMAGPSNLPTTKDDYNLNNTFNVVMPAAWIQTGVKVNIHVAAGVDTSPASLTVTPTVGTPTRIRVVLVPLTIGSTTGTLPSLLTDVQNALAHVYPYANGNIVVEKRAPLTINGAENTNTLDWSNALNQLETARKTENPDAFYYGFVPMYDPIPASFTTGLGFVGNRTQGENAFVSAIGVDWTANAAQGDPFDIRWPQWQTVMIHEMGHNHSLSHAPCGGASNTDPAFPNTTADLGELALYNSSYDSDTQLGVLSAPLTPANIRMKDVMGYCGGTWFSDFSYVRAQQFAETRTAAMTQALVATNTDTKATDGYLTISGELKPQGVLLYPASASATMLQTGATNTKSAYILRVRTAAGQTYQFPFNPASIADTTVETSHFWVSMPNPGAIATIEVLHNGQLQPMRAPSQVRSLKTVAAPTGSTQGMASAVGWRVEKGRLTIIWDTATEPFLSLVYVAPGGAKTVIGNSQNGSASFDISSLPNGGRFDVSLSSSLQARLVSFAH